MADIITILFTLLLISIRESRGSSECGLHILDDAEVTRIGEQLFHFLFFPHFPPDGVLHHPCDDDPTPDVNSGLFDRTTLYGSISKVIECLPTASTEGVSYILTGLYSSTMSYHIFAVLCAYVAIRAAKCTRVLPSLFCSVDHAADLAYIRSDHYVFEKLLDGKIADICFGQRKSVPEVTKSSTAKVGHRKVKNRKEEERQDTLRSLITQQSKSAILPKQVYQLIKGFGLETSLGDMKDHDRPKTHSHSTSRHQCNTRPTPRCTDRIPSGILRDLMESEYTVNQTVSKDKTIVSEAREETRDTLLHRKPESAVERTTHAPSAEGGGGDFVDGADPPQTIGQPCASSSFMSTVDEDTTTPMVVDCDDIAIERISFSLDPVQVACDFEDVTVQPDESPFLEEHLCNNDTNQSYRGDTVFNQTPRLDGYLPNTTNESIDTSLHSTTAGGRGDAGVRGEWSFLGSSMLDDFAGVSDHLERSLTMYRSDDVEVSVYQWVSVAIVARRLAQNVWSYALGQLQQAPPPDSLAPGAASPPTHPSSPLPAPHHQYYPDFEPQTIDMVD